ADSLRITADRPSIVSREAVYQSHRRDDQYAAASRLFGDHGRETPSQASHTETQSKLRDIEPPHENHTSREAIHDRLLLGWYAVEIRARAAYGVPISSPSSNRFDSRGVADT